MLSSIFKKAISFFVILFISNLIYSQSKIIEKLDPFDGKLTLIRYEQGSDLISFYEPQDLSKFENEDFYNWPQGYGWNINLMQIRFNGVNIAKHLVPDLDKFKNDKHGKHSGFFPLSATLQFPDGTKKIFNITEHEEFHHQDGFDYAFWPYLGKSQDGWSMECVYKTKLITVKTPKGDKYIFSVDADNDKKLLSAKIIYFEDSKGNKIEYQYEQVSSKDKNKIKINLLKRVIKNNIPIINFYYNNLKCDYDNCNYKFKIISKISYYNQEWNYKYSTQRIHGKKYIPFLNSITDPNGKVTEFCYNYEANNGRLVKEIRSDNSQVVYQYNSNDNKISSIIYYENKDNIIGSKEYFYNNDNADCTKWQNGSEPLKCITNLVMFKGKDDKVKDKNFYTYASIDSPVWSHGLLLSHKTCDVLDDGSDKCIRTIDLYWDKFFIDSRKFYYNSEKFDKDYNRAILKKKIIEQDKTKYITEFQSYDDKGCPISALEKGITENNIIGARNIKIKKHNFYCGYPKNYNFPIRNNLEKDNSNSNEILTYDAIGRLTSKKLIDTKKNINAVTKYNYIQNNGIEIINALGNKEINFYQAFGDPEFKKIIKNIKNVNFNLIETIFEREQSGLLNKKIKDNYIKEYYYNRDKKLIEYIEPKIGFIKYERDKVNNKIQRTNSNGDIIVNHFDSNKNLVKTHYNKEGQSNYYNYDEKNNLLESINQNGAWYYKYDDKNNIIEEKLLLNNKEFIFKYFYNNENKVASMVYPGLDNKIELKNYISNVVYSSNKKIESFEYGNGIKFKNKFNVFNKPYEINYYTYYPISTLNYGYDVLGNVMKVDGFNNVDLSFEYDSTNRLKKVLNNATNKNFIIEYDNFDNITRINKDYYKYENNKLLEYKYDGAGRVINDKKHNYSYNSNGQVITKDQIQYFYDANGHQLLSKESDRKLITIHNKNGQKLLEIEDNKYTEYYYFDNLLIAKKENGELFYYHYDLFNNVIFTSNEQQEITLGKIDLDNEILNKLRENVGK